MDVEMAKEIINNTSEFELNEKEFLEQNINFKIGKYSGEHLILLKAFYDLSKETIETSRKYKYDQFTVVTYKDIIERIQVKEPVLGICWMDLENDGFIIEVKCYGYAIRPLGIILIEMLAVN